ncbi:hypothetical protein V6C27_06070 [Peptococcaceae bacterium 1198_IL3148]
MKKNAGFIPALKFDWLTRLFDPLMKLTKSEKNLSKLYYSKLILKILILFLILAAVPVR